MTVRSRFLWAAALGLGLPSLLPAQEPARFGAEPGVAARAALSTNQLMANAIAEQLRQSGQLRHYNIDIVYHDGTAELTGTVLDQPQREEALRLVQGLPGIDRVRDRLVLASTTGSGIAQTQAAAPPKPSPEPLPPPPASSKTPTELGPPPRLAPGSTGIQEPVPIFQAPAPGPYDVNQPKMPPYAWPTYAPYNNFSRVAYPTQYPYNSWPFIGPCYPFPKIPPGWRSVKLTWQDGFWWYSRHGTSHDWWVLRYW